MRSFERIIDDNGSYAKYYLQEPLSEIDSNRVYQTIVVCPGGAYLYTSLREDEQVALRFLSEGFNVVIVHYATEGLEKFQTNQVEELPLHPKTIFPNPLLALAKTVIHLKENAQEFHVNTDYIIVAGFSAGGNVAGLLATRWHEKWLGEALGVSNCLFKPTHALLAYTAFDLNSNPGIDEFSKILYATTGTAKPSKDQILQLNLIENVTHDTVPTFIWHTSEDVLTPSVKALEFCIVLEKFSVPYELHLFEKGKHGLVLGDLRTGVKDSNKNAQVYKWVDLFLEWLAPGKTIRREFFQ